MTPRRIFHGAHSFQRLPPKVFGSVRLKSICEIGFTGSMKDAPGSHQRATKQSGQTLVALLIFTMIVISLSSVAVAITISNVRSNNAFAGGGQALAYAESGAENALQRLLRDPGYTGGTISFAHGTATISVSGTTAKTIVSQGTSGNHRRTVTVTANHTNNMLTPASWSETP